MADFDNILEDALEDFEEDEIQEEEEKKLQPDLTNNNNNNNNNDPSNNSNNIPNLNWDNPEKISEQMDSMLKEVFENDDMAQDFNQVLKEMLNGQTRNNNNNDFSNFAKDFQEIMQDMNKNPEQANQFQGLVGEVVNQIISKDFLGETMGELAKRMPDWLKEKESELSENQYKAHCNQLEVVKEIINILEKETNETNKEEILTLMEKLHSFGPLPAGILSDLGPQGMPQGMPQGNFPLEKDCLIQ